MRLGKQINFKKIIIVDNPKFTGIKSATLIHFPEIDIVCYGEDKIINY
jgi:hypothetical protein